MRYSLAALLLCCALPAQTYRGRIGIQVEDFNEGSRSRAFVDLGRAFRPWSAASGSGAVAVDANGWPLTDASTVLFDIRPVPAWAPPIDDPQQFQPDWSGTYHLSFRGQADVRVSDPAITVSAQTWNASANTSTADVSVPSGTGLLVLTFINTKRTPDSAANTGITDLKFIRPGYPAGTGQVFTHEFLESLAPFSVLRFMGVTATNDADSRPYPAVTEWSDRHVLTDATQQSTGGKTGTAWEYVIQLANQSGKDIWINIPVSATEDYIRKLAALLKARLNPGINIYVEHSNEVWNPIFPQYAWNVAAGKAEGVSNLQRHAKRLVTISNLFRDAFGADAINRRVRVVLAWWTIKPEEYDAGLSWVQTTFGVPSQFFYAIAQTHYFNDEKAAATSDVPAILAAMRSDSDNGVATTKRLVAIANRYGLKLTVYEGGPDNGGGRTTNIGKRILANRDPGMQEVVTHDVRDNWFALGGDLYMYFTLSSAYSRYGCWGAVEDILNLNTPKFKALLDLIGPASNGPSIDSISNSASGAQEIAPGAFFSIYGTSFSGLEGSWDSAILDGITLPAALNGLSVRVNNRDAYVSYASPTQINAVAPPDPASGPASVEVITNNGRAARTVDITEVSPAWFGYTLDGTQYAWAVLATEPGPVYIARTGAFGPGYLSRPAKPGDILELFANGLGGLGPDYPAGRVLTAPYEIDKSKVSVTFDDTPAAVLYAGVISPGLYQVNVTVPGVSRSGDVPVSLSIGGRRTQTGTQLTVVSR